jgi:2-polyprenyl-3-methyl-5-hydroxy-6-metoxy-1,4-benzoquinol methylase
MRHRSRLYASYVTSGQAGVADGGEGMPRGRDAFLRKIIEHHVPADRGVRILDLGCGSGALLRCCRDAGYRALEGIDISPEQTRAAHRLGLDCVREGDILGFLQAAPAGCYDVVFALDVLEHFSRDEVLDVLAAVARVVRPGGRFIVHVPNGESPFVGAIRYGDFTHQLAFTRHALAALGRISGFSQVSCYEDRPVPHGALSLVRLVLWHVVRLVLVAVTAIETGDPGRGAVLSRNLLAVLVRDGT